MKLVQVLQPIISKIKYISVATVIAILLILLLVKSCENKHLQKLAEQVRIPDTVYVNKPYKVVEIKTKDIEKPVKVYVYIRDTVLRREVEHQNIITAVDIKHKGLFNKMDFIQVDKITPKGLVLRNEYQLPPLREIKIDGKGDVEIKKKRFPKLKKVVGIVLIGAAGFIIGKEVQSLNK